MLVNARPDSVCTVTESAPAEFWERLRSWRNAPASAASALGPVDGIPVYWWADELFSVTIATAA